MAGLYGEVAAYPRQGLELVAWTLGFHLLLLGLTELYSLWPRYPKSLVVSTLGGPVPQRDNVP